MHSLAKFKGTLSGTTLGAVSVLVVSYYTRMFLRQVHTSIFPHYKKNACICERMLDGIYCQVNDHHLYTPFRNALWDTVNGLYSEYQCSL